MFGNETKQLRSSSSLAIIEGNFQVLIHIVSSRSMAKLGTFKYDVP